jgi:hypothetical protein
MASELLPSDKQVQRAQRFFHAQANLPLILDERHYMYDLTLTLANRPGALATMGESLGRAGVSVEGGGAWVVEGKGVAHFLVADGAAARAALSGTGIIVEAVREVIVQKLEQGIPGQLGKLTRRMADAGVNIEVLYSDHANQLVLVVDDPAKGRAVAAAWMQERRERLERKAP